MNDHASSTPIKRHHHAKKMHGRDPNEFHRVSSPLELLFDLTFVVAMGIAASQFSHACAAGHYLEGLLGFAIAGFAICWAWINFSWFASAYDTDDWIFRLTTMVQMIGVIIVALGLPTMFASIEKGDYLDNSIMVLGYVIMRLSMVFQWLRAARQDSARRRACMAYAFSVSFAQVGWIILAFLQLPLRINLVWICVLLVIEMLGPYIAERKFGGTPWHAHHISERYGLFAIIALGEGVVGTVAALTAVVDVQGWSRDVAFLVIAGVGLTFGMWWVYYMLPSAEVLDRRKDKAFGWGYGQIILIISIVATGAGLHTAGYFIEHKSKIGPLATVLCVAIPVTIFLLSVYAIYSYLVGTSDRFHLLLLAATAVVLITAITAAANGVDMTVCLLILMFAPVVTVVGYETLGHSIKRMP